MRNARPNGRTFAALQSELARAHDQLRETRALAETRAEVIRRHKETIGELEARLAQASRAPMPVEMLEQLSRCACERETYRQALAEIEGTLHRLGNGCGFGHEGDGT